MDLFTISACAVICAVFYVVLDAVAKLVIKLKTGGGTSKFEGPHSLPIIGSTHLLLGGGEAILNRLQKFDKLYPKPYRMFLGNNLVLVTSNPDQMKVIFNSSKTVEKSDIVVDLFRPWPGSGLAFAPSSTWRVRRKMIQPTFGLPILQSFLKLFAAKVGILVKQVEKHVDGPEFDVQKYLSLCALDTICGTAMGVDLEAQTKEDCCYAEAVQAVLAGVCTRMFSPWLYPDFIYYRTKFGKDQQEKIKFLNNFAENIIRMKKKEILERTSRPGSADEKYDDCDTMARREIFLDHLIKLSGCNETLTDQAIREEVDTFILGGSDTTSIAMSFLILMLASHQNIQEKVYEEICEIHGDEDSGELNVTTESLSRMVYLERVIKETLRLFPIIPFLGRKVTEDLNIGEYTLPKGSTAAINIIGVHRSEEYWIDPLKFNPDRFSPEKFAKQHPYTYIPFAGGLRNCIGFKYAMLLMKTLAVTVLWRYTVIKNKIVPVEDIRIKIESELQPVERITVAIKRRIKKGYT